MNHYNEPPEKVEPPKVMPPAPPTPLSTKIEILQDALAFDEDRIQHLENEIAQLHIELEEKDYDIKVLTNAHARLREEIERLKQWGRREIERNAKSEIKLRAENTEIQEALQELAKAEYRYRLNHDVEGEGSIEAGRSWDNMRHKGDLARILLTKCSENVCSKSPDGRHSFHQDTDGFHTVLDCTYCGKRQEDNIK